MDQTAPSNMPILDWHGNGCINYSEGKEMLHFIGMKGDEYLSAVRVWGLPDFYHRYYDYRCTLNHGGEIDPERDTIVFARGCEDRLHKPYHSFNDSEVF